MSFARTLGLLIVCQLMLTGCGSSGGGAQIKIEPLPANISAPCERPEAFLDANDWAIMAGRLGGALIDCGQKHDVAVGYVEALTDYLDGGV